MCLFGVLEVSALFISVCAVTKVRYDNHCETSVTVFLTIFQTAKKKKKKHKTGEEGPQKQVNDTMKTDFKNEIIIIRKKLP